VRLALVLAGAAFALAGTAGCTTDGGDTARSNLATQLGRLCDESRLAVEKLGEPRDVGAAVFHRWAQVGRRFVADARRLPTETAAERQQLRSLARYFGGFYANLAIAYRMYRAQQSTAIKQVLERGYAFLASAERIATRIGATECAVRPYADT